VWSTDWYMNQRLEEQRLRLALEAAMITSPKPADYHITPPASPNDVETQAVR